MPESYLHVRCARRALARCGLPKYDIPAVVAGSAGPDILFYHVGARPLVRLGLRLHRERCGPFLSALVRGADSPVLRGYVLGFLSHNATDATLHPWIAAQEESHAALESALDSVYLQKDKGRRSVLPGDCAARLRPEKAAEIAVLLRRAIGAVYGAEVSVHALARSFGQLYGAKALLREERVAKRRMAAAAERVFRLERGTLAGHLTPGAPLTETAEAEALVTEAETLAADMMAAAQAYWDGAIGPLELARRLGNRSYETGESGGCP